MIAKPEMNFESTQKTDILKGSPLLKVYEEDRNSKSSIPDVAQVKKSNMNNLKKMSYASNHQLTEQSDLQELPEV